MEEVLTTVLNYLLLVMTVTGRQLILILGPPLLLAFLMHFLSNSFRNRAAMLFGHRPMIWLTAPGVMIHELGHAFFCILFGHRIREIKLFQWNDDKTLGYVNHEYNPKSFYQKSGNFFIGTGPIWFGMALIYLMIRFLEGAAFLKPFVTIFHHESFFSVEKGSKLLEKLTDVIPEVGQSLQDPALLQNWQFWFFLYLLFCIGSHITLSPPDIKGAFSGLLTLVLGLLVLNMGTLWFGDYTIQAENFLLEYLSQFLAAMLLVLISNMFLFIPVFLISLFASRRR